MAEKSETILLVDDEEGIRRVLGISLMDSGYHVLTAASGEEALGIFKEAHPEIVLTDIKMPGMDGIELLRRIKEMSPDTEVIMITGHGELDLAIKSLQYEAARFITKPINHDALDIALKRVRERISMRKELLEYTQEVEQLVEDKAQKLIEAERMAAIGQTVATLAHAIKNIMGGLKGGIYVVEKGIELDNRKYLIQGWQMIKGNVNKIHNLAMDLLTLTKEREPEYRLCDPNEPAREVYQLMLPRAHECGISLELRLDSQLTPVYLDPDGIHCCILNLVTNAIEACMSVECSTKLGEVLIRTVKQNGWAVVYEVIDNACGMDQETRNKIFRTFFSTKGTKGTGLGLMITRKIVHEHGGIIQVESEKGCGTQFILRLPGREMSP